MIPQNHNLTILFVLVFTFSHAQVEVTKSTNKFQNACKCIEKISFAKAFQVRIDAMNECMKSALIDHKVAMSTTNLTSKIDSLLVKATKVENNTIIISDDKLIMDLTVTEDDMSDMRSVLLESCPAMETLMMDKEADCIYNYSDDQQALEYYGQGQRYDAQGKLEKVAKAYRKAVETDFRFAYAWDNLGLAYRKLEQYDKAIEAYEKSLEVNALNPTPLMNMAVAYKMKGDLDKSLELYAKFIETYPDDPEGYYGMAWTGFQAERFEVAADKGIQAYLMYAESESPYVEDAVKILRAVYAAMKENGNEQKFIELADKHGLKME